MRLFSTTKGDGDITGDFYCEKHADELPEDTDYVEIFDPKESAECVCCKSHVDFKKICRDYAVVSMKHLIHNMHQNTIQPLTPEQFAAVGMQIEASIIMTAKLTAQASERGIDITKILEL